MHTIRKRKLFILINMNNITQIFIMNVKKKHTIYEFTCSFLYFIIFLPSFFHYIINYSFYIYLSKFCDLFCFLTQKKDKETKATLHEPLAMWCEKVHDLPQFHVNFVVIIIMFLIKYPIYIPMSMNYVIVGSLFLIAPSTILKMWILNLRF